MQKDFYASLCITQISKQWAHTGIRIFLMLLHVNTHASAFQSQYLTPVTTVLA